MCTKVKLGFGLCLRLVGKGCHRSLRATRGRVILKGEDNEIFL